MRVIVKIQPPRGSGASSSAAHYVAWDDIDPEREGEGPRPLFSNKGHDDLTYSGADRYLGGEKGVPSKADLLHIIVSFNMRDYDALGATDEERDEGLREVIREGMADFFEELCAEHGKLKAHKYYSSRRDSRLEEKWVAGIHKNTKKPHVHVIFLSQVLEKGAPAKQGKSHKSRSHKIGFVPKSLLAPSRQSRDKGVPQDELGKIGRGFANALDRAQERARRSGLQRSNLGMGQSSSFNDFIFETPLVDRGVSHYTIETYLLSNMLSGRDHELRSRIAACAPDEARRIRLRLSQLRQSVKEEERQETINAFPEDIKSLAAKANVREEWPRIQAGVLWTAVRHAFGPGTAAYKRLRSLKESDLPDVTGSSFVGKFLRRIRGVDDRGPEKGNQGEEVRLTIPKTFLDRLSDETRSWLTSELIPEIEHSLGAGKTRREIFAEIDGHISSRPLPAGGIDRDKEMDERGIIDAVLKARIPKTFLDRLSDETRSWLTSELIPEIDRSLDAGKTRREIFAEIDGQISSRPLPAGGIDRDEEMGERDIIDAVLKARVHRSLYSDDRLAELVRRNTSMVGREITMALLERGPEPEPGSPPDVFNNIRDAFREPQIYETYYASPPARSDELRAISPLRAMEYDDGTLIKDGILIYPTEPHQLNPLIHDRPPFITERRYAHQVIKEDPQKANEFFDLGERIGGRAATPKGLIGVFRHFYAQLKLGEDGHQLNYKDKEGREQALDRTLNDMRYWAGEMEEFERLAATEPESLSVDGMPETELYRLAGAEWRGARGMGFGDHPDDEASLFEQEVAKYSRMAWARTEGADLASGGIEEESIDFEEDAGRVPEVDDSDSQAEDLGEGGDELESGAEQDRDGEDEFKDDTRAGAYVFNTAFLTQNLRDESLRFPAGLSFEVRKKLVEIHLPNLDAEIEAGKRPVAIHRDISRMVLGWNLGLQEEGDERQKLQDQNDRIGALLHAYVEKMLEDPETRALNTSEEYRDVHARIMAARSPVELMREVDSGRKRPALNEWHRRLLTGGRSSDFHSQEMREIRQAGWMTLDERVEALSEGRLPMSDDLKKLLAIFHSCNSEGEGDYFVQSVKRRPEELKKPEKSIELGIWKMRERLTEHELQFLLNETWKWKKEKMSFGGRSPSQPETASRLEDFRPAAAPVSSDNESVRIYREAVRDSERIKTEELSGSLGGARLSQEQLDEIRGKAVNSAFAALVPDGVDTGPLEGAKKRLSDDIWYAQEELVPRLQVARRSLRDFYEEKLRKFGVSHPFEPAHVEELARLGERDKIQMRALTEYMGELKSKWAEVFARIDESRLELLQDHGREALEKTAFLTVEADAHSVNPAPLSPAPDLAARDIDGPQTSPPTPVIDSLREYRVYLAEKEEQLISEALEQQAAARGDGEKTEQVERLLALAVRREVRDKASDEALNRLERLDSAGNLSVGELLLVGEALNNAGERLKQMRSRAQQAALLLDTFIIENVVPNIDPVLLDKMKVDGGLYYGKIPKEALLRLDPERQNDFRTLSTNAAKTLTEFSNGVREIGVLKASGNFVGGAIKNNYPQDPGGSLIDDRRVLGEEMVIEVLVECRRLDYTRALNNGDMLPPGFRDENARMNSRQDLGFQSPKLEEHAGKLDGLIPQLESRYQYVLNAHRRARERAGEVIGKHRESGGKPPTPFIRPEDLAMAQGEAIKHWLPDHVKTLEELRRALESEPDFPARTDDEVKQILALRFFAGTEYGARKRLIRRFDQTFHLREWPTDGGGRLSLAEIDRQIEQLNNNRPAIEVLGGLINKPENLPSAESMKRTAAEDMRPLLELRHDLVRKIDSKRLEMTEGLAAVGKVIRTLDDAYDYEAARRNQMPEPTFTPEVLERSARNIAIAGLTGHLRALSAHEMAHYKQAAAGQQIDSAGVWGLSQGRLAVGWIELCESKARQQSFDEAFDKRREDYRIPFRTDSGDLFTINLRDVRPKSGIGIGAESPEERKLRQYVGDACRDYKRSLMVDVADAKDYVGAARQDASIQAVVWGARARKSGIEASGPTVPLTPWEKHRVEYYALGLPESSKEEKVTKEGLLSWARGEAVGRINPNFYVDHESNMVLIEQRAGRREAPVKGPAR